MIVENVFMFCCKVEIVLLIVLTNPEILLMELSIFVNFVVVYELMLSSWFSSCWSLSSCVSNCESVCFMLFNSVFSVLNVLFMLLRLLLMLLIDMLNCSSGVYWSNNICVDDMRLFNSELRLLIKLLIVSVVWFNILTCTYWVW
jgi:hypothetical protein